MVVQKTSGTKVHYVGIAASAGGLEATSALANHLPPDFDAVYVVAQHMAPQRESLLTALIARETALDVAELTEDVTEPKPRTIYIPPPNKDVVLQDGKLQLVTPRDHPATPKPSADRLFISIAEACGKYGIGIVLSGTGSDGSYGIQSIREHGGLTIAQDPETAKFDGMPSSAIATGCVDLTLDAKDIGPQLQKVLQQKWEGGGRLPEKPPLELHAELMQLIHARTRVDFREYKDQTVYRRIQRRLDALGLSNFAEYVDLCRSQAAEIDVLYKDLLISVTRFFRDTDQFTQLRQEISDLVARKDGKPLRLWVAGCATGEEAYTVAILLAEAMGGPDQLEKSGAQIFATDIDEQALEIARKGSYPVTAAHDVPSEYVKKYFRLGPRRVDVTPELRGVTVFSRHNIIQDPPFINIDLVTLRNVLIYFKPPLQERVLSRIHYGLAPKGVLMLGTSESIRAMELLFTTQQGSDRIYIKNETGRRDRLFLPEMTETGQVTLPGTSKADDKGPDSGAQMFEALARSVSPNSFLITRGQDILRVFGDVSPMLELNETTSLRLSTRILRRGLRDEAPSLISVSFRQKEAREGRWHNISGPGFNQVQLICYPIFQLHGEDTMLLGFRTRTKDTDAAPIESLSDQERTQYILQIETEMHSTREALQQTVEELQTTNEELQSVNEELQSTNEELQATNEELETSNEELQSTNEELITVNEEMQINASELQKVSRELSALLAESPHPVLLVDKALLVRRASKSALAYFDIDEIPVNGLPLSELQAPELFPVLPSVAAKVIKSEESETFELTVREQLHTAIVAPFYGASKQLMGLTISVFDYDAKTMAHTVQSMAQMGDIDSWNYNVKSGLLTLSAGLLRRFDMAHLTNGMSLAEAEALVHPDDRADVRRRIKKGLESKQGFRFEVRILFKNHRILHAHIAGRAVLSESGQVVSIVGAWRDVTAGLSTSMLIENVERIQSKLGLSMFSYDVDNDELNILGGGLLELENSGTHQSLSSLKSVIDKESKRAFERAWSTLMEQGGAQTLKLRLKTGASCEFQANARTRADERVSHIYGSLQLQTE